MIRSTPNTNPDDLLRLRDSNYAADLLITAISYLDFFSWLEVNPADFNSIVEHFKIDPRPADVMLTYFSALSMVLKEDGLFRVSEKAKEFLTRKSEFSLVSYFSTQSERPTVEKMYEVLRTGIPASWGAKKNESDWEKAMGRDDFAEIFTSGMDSRGAYFAPALAKNFNFSQYNSILDIAGASGIYAACIKEQCPAIRAVLFEKPPVDRIAKMSLARKGLSDKIEVLGGDMFYDELPSGYDIHLYSHALHDWGIEDNRKIIRNSFRTLNPGGVIMIHDAHINRLKNGPLSVAEYSVLLMFSTNGKCYSVAELEELLTSEGFADIKYQETIGNRSVITGKKENK